MWLIDRFGCVNDINVFIVFFSCEFGVWCCGCVLIYSIYDWYGCFYVVVILVVLLVWLLFCIRWYLWIIKGLGRIV